MSVGSVLVFDYQITIWGFGRNIESEDINRAYYSRERENWKLGSTSLKLQHFSPSFSASFAVLAFLAVEKLSREQDQAKHKEIEAELAARLTKNRTNPHISTGLEGSSVNPNTAFLQFAQDTEEAAPATETECLFA